ncbi:MAG: damage-inducible protein DinB [Rhodospirillaceae bacterium]|nr:damage-inducible protein DinB [Rhodospirillaceae bacterium]
MRGSGGRKTQKNIGAFFKSIHGTLNHILLCDQAWMSRFVETPNPHSTLDAELYDDYDELCDAQRQMDRRTSQFAAELTPEWLTGPLKFQSLVSGGTFTYPRWQLVLQMFNHQTHHRGQITTMMKQFGVDPGLTDFAGTPGIRPNPQPIPVREVMMA